MKGPLDVQLDGNIILGTDHNGNLVPATKEHGFDIGYARIKLVRLDEFGNPIPDDDDENRELWSKQHKENAAIRTDSDKNFVFAMTDGPIERFAPDLKLETLTKLVMLSTYADFANRDKDSMLVIGNRYAKKTPMTTADIQKELGLSNSTFYEFMNDVLPQVNENGEVTNTPYIYKLNDTYFLNKEFFLRSHLPKGSHSNINKIFVEPVRRLYNLAMVSQHRKLGMVFALLPYINREWNIVCWNPLEANPALVEALTMTEICEVLDLSKKNAARTINGMIKQIMKITLKIDGARQFFCGLFETDERKEMIINPNFIYIGRRKNDVMQSGARFVHPDDVEIYQKAMSEKRG